MVGSLAQRESWCRGVTIDALSNKDVPVGIGCRDRVRITSCIRTVPCDSHMAIRIGGDPGENIRLPGLGRALSYLDRGRPGCSKSRRIRVVDVGIVRPDGVQVPKVIYCERGE